MPLLCPGGLATLLLPRYGSRLPFTTKKDAMGFFYSIVSSAAFGLIPLFTLPLMKLGVSGATALFYRFAIATVVLGIVLGGTLILAAVARLSRR